MPMKILLKIMVLSSLLLFLSCDKNNPEPNNEEINGLVIEISGLRNNNGVIQLELTDEAENVIKTVTAVIEEKKSTITFLDLSDGSYAFKYFHDENSNKTLDTNDGFPSEGYGFSNNASGTFGPPSIDKMIFEYNKPMKMACSITYLF